MIDTPFFTVAIPVFNRLIFLKDAINSVLNQAFDDFELLLVDDHSTDGSWEYIKELKDPRIRLIRNKENLGIVGNWKRCIENANGRYFKFLMSDDILFADALYLINELLKKYPGNSVVVTSGIGFREDREIEKYMNIKPRQLEDPDRYLKSMDHIIDQRKHFNQTWANPDAYTLPTSDLKELVKTDEFRQVEAKLGKTGHCVDYYILYAVAKKHRTMIEMDLPLYGIRYHEANLSRTYSDSMLYHLEGDRYIHYLLYDYKGRENLYIIRHAFRVYFHKIKNRREILSLAFIKKKFELLVFIFRHIFNISRKAR